MILPEIVKNCFLWSVRVYYEDTDSFGVVYYANYLKFMERARTEWLRLFGFSQQRIRSEMDRVFVVRSAKIEYKRPAVLDDELIVETFISGMGRIGIEFEQNIYRMLTDEKVLLAHGIIKVGCLSASQWMPAPIPQMIREALQSDV